MRAHLYRPIQDNQGDIRSGVTVSVYEPGSTVLTTTPLYPSSQGEARLANPFVAHSGVVDFYTSKSARFRLGIKAGNENEYFIEDLDSMAPAVGIKYDLPAPLALEPGSGHFIYTPIPMAARALIYRLEIHSSGTTNWGIRIRGGPNETDELFFEAIGIGTTTYNASWPWMYECQIPDTSLIYIGVDDLNKSPSTTFTLQALRAEVFVP